MLKHLSLLFCIGMWMHGFDAWHLKCWKGLWNNDLPVTCEDWKIAISYWKKKKKKGDIQKYRMIALSKGGNKLYLSVQL